MAAQDRQWLFDLAVPARCESLPVTRAVMRAALDPLGLPAPVIEDVVLAVGEACQNVVRHAYGGQEGGVLELALFHAPSVLVVEVRDQAPPLDPSVLTPGVHDPLTPGGLGLHLIHALMDDVSLASGAEGRGNVLRLSRTLPVQEGAAAHGSA